MAVGAQIQLQRFVRPTFQFFLHHNTQGASAHSRQFRSMSQELAVFRAHIAPAGVLLVANAFHLVAYYKLDTAANNFGFLLHSPFTQ